MRLTPELGEKVAAIFRRELESEFGDSVTFDPIVADLEHDMKGIPTFDLTIVYDGEEDMDMRRALLAIGATHPQVEDLGLESWPAWSFVKKANWPELKKLRDEALSEIGQS